jgi:glycosyltransferase 2 family protein
VLTRSQLARPIAVLATLAISVGFGYLALRGIRFNATWHAFAACNYWWLVPSLGALAASILVRVIRWRMLFDPARRPPYVSLLKATTIGYFFNSILPARAGEIARIVALKKYADTPPAETTATVVIERLFDVGSLLVLLFAFLPWLPHLSWVKPALLVALACVGAVVLLIVVGRLASKRETPWGSRLFGRALGAREETIARVVRNALHGLSILERPRRALAALAWTFLSWFLLALSFWCLMLGFHLGLSPLAGLLVVIATGLAFIIPAAPAAVGLFEAAGLVVTSAYDVPRSSALAYVLVLHILNFAPFILAGLLLLAADRGARRVSAATAVELRSAD